METPTFDSQLESTRLKFDVEYLPGAQKYISGFDQKDQEKILEGIGAARIRQDPKLFKKVTNGLWEFRFNIRGSQCRLLAFWHKRHEVRPVVYVTHGFTKKTAKIPPNELARANYIRKQLK